MRKKGLKLALAGALLCTTLPMYGLHTFAKDATDEVQVADEQADDTQTEAVTEDVAEESTDDVIYGGGKEGSTYNLAYTLTGTGNYTADPTASDSMVFYKFVAPTDGCFTITSHSDSESEDPKVAFEQRTLDNTIIDIDSNDDGGDGNNFSLSGVMKAGESYYFLISNWYTYSETPIPFSFEFDALVEGWNTRGESKFYVKDGHVLTEQWEKIDGYWYYFKDNSVACCDEIYGLWSEKDLKTVYYGFDKNGHMVKGIATFDGQKYYFDDKGIQQMGFVTIGNDTYYFNDSMVVDQIWFTSDSVCYFGKDGKMQAKYSLKPGWMKLGGYWYYYDGDDFVYSGWKQISGKWYYFEEQHPVMNTSGFFPVRGNPGESEVYCFDADGAMATGWQLCEGSWYYFAKDGIGQFGLVTDSKGDRYYITEGGILMDVVEHFYDDEDGLEYYGYFDKNGKLKEYHKCKTGWMQFNGKWYYYDGEEGGLVGNDIITYGGYDYYFNYSGIMVTNGEYEIDDGTIRVDEKGHLIKGWYKDLLGNWQYYDDKGLRYDYGIASIGGKYYLFYQGYMQKNITVIQEGVKYVFDAKGNCTSSKAVKNGWVQDDYGWYYYEDGKPISNCMRKIGSYTYGFDSDGCMYESCDHCWGSDRYYFDANGHLIYGWYQDAYGRYYYADSTGKLYTEGMYSIDGKSYFFDRWGMLEKNYAYYNEAQRKLYVWDGIGNLKTYSASDTGWVYFDYYLDKGQAVRSNWKKIDGYWYYFDEKAEKQYDKIITVDGKRYYLDGMGRMQTGWIACYDGWYYADASGVLCEEQWKTINGKKYYFRPSACNDICMVDGKWQVFEDYVWVKTLEDPEGWVKAGGRWFYFKSGNLVKDRVENIDGDYYFFDEKGVMSVNLEVDDYYFGANGRAIRDAWYEVEPGQWKYFGPDGRPYYNDIRYIKGKFYAFNGQGIMYKETAEYYGSICSVGTDGSVNVIPLQNGWFTDDEGARGYVRDGEPIYYDFHEIDGKTYYFREGRIIQYDFIYNGSVYFADKNGAIVKNGWFPYHGSYVYAGADGKLLMDLQTVGGKQYYFTPVMLKSTFNTGTEYLEIAANGVVTNIIKAKGTGWVKTSSGDWLYSRNGIFVKGTQIIDGKTYQFDYETGHMCKNSCIDYLGYVGSSGALEKNNGWIKSNDGYWYYYADGILLSDELCINGKEYYVSRYGYGNTTGPVYLNGHYYNYDGNGVRKLVTCKDGWTKCNGQWIYMENGYFVDGARKIDGKWYYFENGLMLTNYVDFTYGKYGRKIMYFGADGTAVKNKWIDLGNGEWYYIGADGYSVVGEYTINGKKYNFDIYGEWEESDSYIYYFPGR